MKNFFNYEGSFYRFMNKMGNMIVISLLFVVTSLPLITLIPSLSALYYATVKTVRAENGYPLKEYMKAFKRDLKNGVVLSLLFIIIGLVLYVDLRYVSQSQSLFGAISFGVLSLLAFIWLSLLIYMPIVWSRFSLRKFELFKRALLMVFRHLPVTLILLLSLLVVGVAVYLIPMPLLFIFPSLWVFGVSFLFEGVLRKYMPVDALGDLEKWYINM